MSQGIQMQALPSDGSIWRAEWIGRMFSPTTATAGLRNTPMIEVYFRKLDKARQNTNTTMMAFLSVMEWPRLRAGTLWRDGSLVPTRLGHLTRKTFHVEFGRTTTKMTRAYTRVGKSYIIPPFAYSVPPLFHYSMVCVAKGARDVKSAIAPEVDLIIPCTEVFRAWYGINARFAYHLTTGAWTDIPNHRIYDKERSWEHKRMTMVQLADRMKNIDAAQVARLAFDPVAEQQVKNFIVNSITATNNGTRYVVAIRPPFNGCSNLEVSGIEIETLESVLDSKGTVVKRVPWRRFLALEIHRCTGPLPFDPQELYFARDNDGMEALNGNTAERSAFEGVVKKKHLDTDTSVQIFEDVDPDVGDAPIEFPDYEVAPVFNINLGHRTENEDAESKSRSRTIETREKVTGGSSGVGTQHTPRNSIVLEPMDEGEGDDSDVGSLAYFRRSIDTLREEAQAAGHAVLVDIEIRSMRWHRTVADPSLWATMPFDGKRRARRALLASIALNGEIFHLFEIERRAGDEFATQLVWKSDGSAVPGPTFQRIFAACAQNQGNLRDEKRWDNFGLLSVQRAAVNHHHSNTADMYGRRMLRRLLSSKPAAPSKPGTANPLESDQESA